MRATILPKAIILNKSHRATVSIMAKGVSYDSEGFLIFTTQLCSYLCNYYSIIFIYLQEGSFATGVLPTANTSLSSLPFG